MYFTRIRKTTAQFEVMISALTKEYGATDDDKLCQLIAKYFEVSEEDAKISLQAYRALQEEDYEQQSKKVEYAGL